MYFIKRSDWPLKRAHHEFRRRNMLRKVCDELLPGWPFPIPLFTLLVEQQELFSGQVKTEAIKAIGQVALPNDDDPLKFFPCIVLCFFAFLYAHTVRRERIQDGLPEVCLDFKRLWQLKTFLRGHVIHARLKDLILIARGKAVKYKTSFE